MTALTLPATRAELVDDLAEAGWKAYHGVRQASSGKLAVVTFDDPFLTNVETFGPDEMLANLRLFLVFATASDDTYSAMVDDELMDVLPAINVRWTLRDVSGLFLARDFNSRPACRLRLNTQIKIIEGN